MPGSVSVVIPTYSAPALVPRAIESALRQTRPAEEVIVVIDGPDAETRRAVAALGAASVRVIERPEHGGAARARNAGIAIARGDWIAMLDHDDEWLPQKLERQLDAVAASTGALPVASCRLIARTGGGDFHWPRRLLAEHEPIGDFLFSRRSLFAGEGLLQSSTLLFRRELALAVPFRSEAATHDDYDWCLRAGAVAGVHWNQLPEPLVVWNFDQGRETLTEIAKWQDSLAWIESVRPLLSPRAYAGFLLTIAAPLAASRGDWRAVASLVRRAFRGGRPTAVHGAVLLGACVLHRDTRRSLRRRFAAPDLTVPDRRPAASRDRRGRA